MARLGPTSLYNVDMAANTSNLKPFTGGSDPRRGVQKSPVLDDPEKFELFVDGLANGASNKELAEIFDVTPRSICNYKRDPRVRAAALKFIEDRVLRITRKTDSIIEQRLQDADELDTDTLLKIRKEFLGGAFRLQTQGGKTDAKTINDAMDEIEENPEFAKELQELLARQPAKS
jgi:hypothetical protein